MHEFSLAESLLTTSLAEAGKAGAARVVQVNVRIGALAGVVEESLEFAFSTLSEGTPAEGAQLRIETVPLRCYCARCASEFEARLGSYRCPTCREQSREIRSGRELQLTSIEVS